MAELKILVPEATTNYILNPSLRFDTTGWASFGSTISRTLDAARFGIASLQIVTNGSAAHEGAYYRVNALDGISDTVTVSAYVKGSGYVRIRLIDYPSGGEWASRAVSLRSDRWTRIEVGGRVTGSNDVRLYVETAQDTPQAATFYMDAAQMERKPYSTTYCDGDQSGCRWNIIEHDSLSTRTADTRAGGRWVKLAGNGRAEDNLYLTVAGGLGMAPISLNTQSYAMVPGSFYQNHKVLARPITFTFHAKNRSTLRECNASLAELHRLRQFLLDLVKPDRSPAGEAFWLQYQDGATAIQFSARYEAGLEGEWDVRNQWTNSFPLRLLSVSPMLLEDNQYVSQLGIRDDGDVNYILHRSEGGWSGMNGGFNGQVLALAMGSRGEIIAVGSFTVANNSLTATDPMIPANRIAWWDGLAWNQYGVGANGTIRAVAVAPNGYIYVTGDFTSIGGVAANRAAYWDGAAWNAMGSGLNGAGYAVAASPTGDVYFGGAFTDAGYYCAKWNGAWATIGAQQGLNAAVRAIAISTDGSLVYFGGDFTDEQGNPATALLEYVGAYDPTTNEFEDMGTGFDAPVYALLTTPSGRLYAAGEFTESSNTSLTFLYTAYWNGAAWYPYGVGGDTFIRALDADRLGNILLGGDFSRIGSDATRYAALWNGSTFVSLDAQVDNGVYAVLYGQDGDIYLAPNGTEARWARRTTITNIGSAEVSPRVYIKGPATVRWIENQTTRKRVYADLTLNENEEVFIDFAQGTILSNMRGNLVWGVNEGSDIRSFTLIPGENVIAAMLLDDVGALMQISYTVTHWSVDATARIT